MANDTIKNIPMFTYNHFIKIIYDNLLLRVLLKQINFFLESSTKNMYNENRTYSFNPTKKYVQHHI